MSSVLYRVAAILPSDEKALEIGYNSGMISCYMLIQYELSEFDLIISCKKIWFKRQLY
ncbi:hypothetical protein [Desulfobacula toluolica]|uniref:hypothetical protein n=1 Tax=Desulfobacula toluolica TaxID=28223 RepID=UPI00031B6629|nr:hypothetical protein [Desulfobacula toluolica]